MRLIRRSAYQKTYVW